MSASSQQDVWEHAIQQARQQAARLLYEVLEERLLPQLAINRWPVISEPVQDLSLEIAYQALWHFEADETQQTSEVFYLDAQLELLRQMATFLEQGRPLPGYMLKLYPSERCVHFFYDISPWKDLKTQIQKQWYVIFKSWYQAFNLLVPPLDLKSQILRKQKPL